jgi:putative spermidine/putrescine transport system substrate-binding protein
MTFWKPKKVRTVHFAKLDTIKDTSSGGLPVRKRRSFWPTAKSSSARPTTAVCSRLIEEQDQPVKMLWDAQVFDLDGWIIPPVCRKTAWPREGLRDVRHRHAASCGPGQVHLLRPGPQVVRTAGRQARRLGIDMAPHMPTDPNNAKNTFLYNYEWWADYRDDIDAKFQAWLAQ